MSLKPFFSLILALAVLAGGLFARHPAMADALINALESDVFEAERELNKKTYSFSEIVTGRQNCQDLVNYFWKQERSYTEITKKDIDGCYYEEVEKKIEHNEGYVEYLRCEMWYARYFVAKYRLAKVKKLDEAIDIMNPIPDVSWRELGSWLVGKVGDAAKIGYAVVTVSDISDLDARIKIFEKRAEHYQKRYEPMVETLEDDKKSWKTHIYAKADCPPKEKKTITTDKTPVDPTPPPPEDTITTDKGVVKLMPPVKSSVPPVDTGQETPTGTTGDVSGKPVVTDREAFRKKLKDMQKSRKKFDDSRRVTGVTTGVPGGNAGAFNPCGNASGGGGAGKTGGSYGGGGIGAKSSGGFVGGGITAKSGGGAFSGEKASPGGHVGVGAISASPSGGVAKGAKTLERRK